MSRALSVGAGRAGLSSAVSTVPDRGLEALLDRFARWRRMIIGHSKRELKGSELTDNQLVSFMQKVLPSPTGMFG